MSTQAQQNKIGRAREKVCYWNRSNALPNGLPEGTYYGDGSASDDEFWWRMIIAEYLAARGKDPSFVWTSTREQLDAWQRNNSDPNRPVGGYGGTDVDWFVQQVHGTAGRPTFPSTATWTEDCRFNWGAAQCLLECLAKPANEELWRGMLTQFTCDNCFETPYAERPVTPATPAPKPPPFQVQPGGPGFRETPGLQYDAPQQGAGQGAPSAAPSGLAWVGILAALGVVGAGIWYATSKPAKPAKRNPVSRKALETVEVWADELPTKLSSVQRELDNIARAKSQGDPAEIQRARELAYEVIRSEWGAGIIRAAQERGGGRGIGKRHNR